MHFLHLLLCLVFASSVAGDTEVINFLASEDVDVDIPFARNWVVLDVPKHGLQRNVTTTRASCTGDVDSASAESKECLGVLWVELDLDRAVLAAFAKYTLRLSWPAFYPVDMDIKLYTPQAFVSQFLPSGTSPSLKPTKTRRKYARIHVLSAGVLTPRYGSVVSDVPTSLVVPIILLLEPLYLGVLPASVLPTLGAIVFVVMAALPVANLVNVHLRKVAVLAREEVKRKDRMKE